MRRPAAIVSLVLLCLAAGWAGAQTVPEAWRDTVLDPKYCDAVAAEVARIAPGHAVELPAGPIAAGAEHPVRWRRAEPAARLPSYLIVAFDGPVRFSGEGFYALAPGARAPFDIAFGRDATRAIVPLQQAGIALEGGFAFRPLSAGRLAISAALVTASGCGPHLRNETVERLTVTPGTPVIQVSDPFDVSRPEHVIRSPAGDRAIELFGNRWRLREAGSGLLVAEGIGRQPRFSPTGRFMTVFGEASIDLVDTLDGERVAELTQLDAGLIQSLAWTGSDSFLVLGAGSGGAVSLQSTLAENRTHLTSHTSCNACTAFTDAGLSIDLENNVVIAMEVGTGQTQPFIEIASLSTGLTYDSLGLNAGSEQFAHAGDFLDRTSAVVRTPPVERAAFLPGVRFSVLFGQAGPGAGFEAGDNPDRIAAAAAYMPPDIADPAGTATEQAEVAIATPRGAVALSRGVPDLGGRMKRRLAEFGIPIDPVEPLAAVPPAEFPFLGEIEDGMFTVPTYAMPGGEGLRLVASALAFVCDAIAPAEGEPGTTDVGIGGSGPTAWRHRRAGRTVTVLNGVCAGGSGGNVNGTLFLHDTRHPGEIVNLDDNIRLREFRFGTSCETSLSGCEFELRFAHDRYLLIWSAPARAAAVFDVETRRMLASLNGLPGGGELDEIAVTADGRTLVQLNADGSFAVHDIAGRPGTFVPADLFVPPAPHEAADPADWRPAGPPILHGAFRDDEIVVWTDDGRFDATYEGAAQVALRLPGVSGRYSVRQFEQALHHPGLADAVLSGRFDPPPVRLEAPPTARATITPAAPGRIEIGLRQDSGAPIVELRVYQDGLLTDRFPPAGTGDAIVERRPGARSVTVLAVGANGLTSLPLGRELPPEPADPGRRLSAVAIGVDRYDDARLSRLSFAASDARRLAAALSSGSPLYRDVAVVTLADAQAARDVVIDRIEAALSGPAADDVILFFAGHGLQDDGGRLYLALGATDPDRLAETAIAWEDISTLVAASGRRVTVFLDACHSGLAGRGLFATNDAVVDGLLALDASGVSVFAASKGRELSLETGGAGGGVFTGAVVAALEGRAQIDHDGNGILSAAELFRAVKADVVRATGGAQTPWFARNEMIGDFPVF